ncbi:putative nuclease HARBI1 [Orchesella cincta]|uniref:Putative nuclease HARBI1 n=1 Tax=Orchesella cincta TaxID=48709 RepID=A0A1D2MGL1_ORCCI|nr:putative nuclease HARBI1 [Orchesella cincta]
MIRESTVSEVCQHAVLELLLCDSSSEATGIFDQAIEDVMILQTARYTIPRQPLPKSDKWFTEILPEVDENRFRQFMRVTRKDFAFILQQIENDKCFNGPNSNLQLTVQKQLAITLYKFGVDGSGSSVCNVAALFGVGDGGTVMKIMGRVIQAILMLQPKWITWPNTQERLKIRNFMSDKLPGCIGYIDGSHIPLDEAPIDDPESYFTRKQRYAIQIQAICDNEKRLRNIVVGFPGSVHDARVFSREWIAADSAYANSKYIVTPFKSNASLGTARQRKQFNRYFSGYRVNIECCFGKLKEVFQSLKGLRVRVDSSNGHKLACEWVRACCVLYNIIVPSLDYEMSECELADEEFDVGIDEDNLADEQQRNFVFNFVLSFLPTAIDLQLSFLPKPTVVQPSPSRTQTFPEEADFLLPEEFSPRSIFLAAERARLSVSRIEILLR